MDYILNTVSGDAPWGIIVDLLETNGTLINLGLASKDTMEIPYMPALFKQRKMLLLCSFCHSLCDNKTDPCS